MSKYAQSKKRVWCICQLQGKVAQRDYLHTQKNITRLEMSRERLRVMASQILDIGDCTRSTLLAANMEFGHRLIILNSRQEAMIIQDREAMALLRSEVFLSAQKEERAERDYRQAKKSSTYQRQQDQPYLIRIRRPKQRKSQEGMTT